MGIVSKYFRKGRQGLKRAPRVFALCSIVLTAVVAVAVADVVSNNLDGTVDADLEVMGPLTAGGANGTTTLTLTPTQDAVNGCNVKNDGTLVLDVTSSSPSVATVNPTVTFEDCEGDHPTVTVTPVGQGSTTISFSVNDAGTDAGGSFDVAPATFTVNVNAATVTKQNQTITWGATNPTTNVYGTPFTVSPTSTSGETVTVTSTTEDVCTVSGYTVTPVDVGDCILSGSAPGNTTYNPVSDSLQTYSIGAKSVTGEFTADDKVYNGDNTATVLTRSLVAGSVVGDDDVELSGGSATFDDKNVGTDKVVTLTGASLSGDDADKYTLAGVNTALADITALGITGSFTADDKVYDGSDTATVLTRSVNGAIDGDDVELSGGSATFDDKNVGTDKVVTLTGASLSGDDADNYTLDSVSTTTADITVLSVTGSFTAADKVVDGTTAATVLTRTVNGAIDGDDVSLDGGTATFDNANVGVDKTVTLTGASLAGVDAGNYLLTSVSTALADITFADKGDCGKVIRQPINATLPYSSFKQKSTVPAKFTVCDANGDPIYMPGTVVSVDRLYNGNVFTNTVNEELISTNATAGFRWSETDQQWIWNIATKNMATGSYVYTVHLLDGDTFTFQFSVK